MKFKILIVLLLIGLFASSYGAENMGYPGEGELEVEDSPEVKEQLSMEQLLLRYAILSTMMNSEDPQDENVVAIGDSKSFLRRWQEQNAEAMEESRRFLRRWQEQNAEAMEESRRFLRRWQEQNAEAMEESRRFLRRQWEEQNEVAREEGERFQRQLQEMFGQEEEVDLSDLFADKGGINGLILLLRYSHSHHLWKWNWYPYSNDHLRNWYPYNN